MEGVPPQGDLFSEEFTPISINLDFYGTAREFTSLQHRIYEATRREASGRKDWARRQASRPDGEAPADGLGV